MQTNPRTMIGTTVYMLTNPLITDALQTSISMLQRNAKTIIKRPEQVAQMTVNFHIQPLKDFITPISIRPILAKILGTQEIHA